MAHVTIQQPRHSPPSPRHSGRTRTGNQEPAVEWHRSIGSVEATRRRTLAPSEPAIDWQRSIGSAVATDHANAMGRSACNPEHEEDANKPGPKEAIRGILLMSKPFFVSRATSLRAWVLAVCCIGVTIGLPKFALWYTSLLGHLAMALSQADRTGEEEYEHLLWELMWYILSNMFVQCLEGLFKGMFKLEWRKFITKQLLGSYVRGHAFYTLKMEDPHGEVDNPDQRIAEDVMDFTELAVNFVMFSVGVITTIILFSEAVFEESWRLFCVVVGYAIVYDLIMFRVFGGRLMRLTSKRLEKEADLRFSLIRVRENAEAVAFYHGAECERARCERHFQSVVSTAYRLVFVNSFWLGINSGSGYIGYLLPYFILAPRIFHKQITYGDFVRTQGLCMGLVGAIIGIVSELERLAEIAAHSSRVLRLHDALEKIRAEEAAEKCFDHGSDQDDSSNSSSDDTAEHSPLSPRPAAEAAAAEPGKGRIKCSCDECDCQEPLKMEDVTVATPALGNDILVYGVSLTLAHGSSLLVAGESGVGKSSLLRAIAGLWSRGGGCIRRCRRDKCFFLSQASYICVGSLWDNVAYPQEFGIPKEDFEEGGALSRNSVVSVLRAVDLGHVFDKYGLSGQVNLETLSGGEKQRLAFARVLLRPNLQLILLDEATCAVGEAHESLLYSEMRRRGLKTYISIGHRPGLARFHSHKLTITGRYGQNQQPNVRLSELDNPDGALGASMHSPAITTSSHRLRIPTAATSIRRQPSWPSPIGSSNAAGSPAGTPGHLSPSQPPTSPGAPPAGGDG